MPKVSQGQRKADVISNAVLVIKIATSDIGAIVKLIEAAETV